VGGFLTISTELTIWRHRVDTSVAHSLSAANQRRGSRGPSAVRRDGDTLLIGQARQNFAFQRSGTRTIARSFILQMHGVANEKHPTEPSLRFFSDSKSGDEHFGGKRNRALAYKRGSCRLISLRTLQWASAREEGIATLLSHFSLPGPRPSVHHSGASTTPRTLSDAAFLRSLAEKKAGPRMLDRG